MASATLTSSAWLAIGYSFHVHDDHHALSVMHVKTGPVADFHCFVGEIEVLLLGIVHATTVLDLPPVAELRRHEPVEVIRLKQPVMGFGHRDNAVVVNDFIFTN